MGAGRRGGDGGEASGGAWAAGGGGSGKAVRHAKGLRMRRVQWPGGLRDRRDGTSFGSRAPDRRGRGCAAGRHSRSPSAGGSDCTCRAAALRQVHGRMAGGPSDLFGWRYFCCGESRGLACDGKRHPSFSMRGNRCAAAARYRIAQGSRRKLGAASGIGGCDDGARIRRVAGSRRGPRSGRLRKDAEAWT